MRVLLGRGRKLVGVRCGGSLRGGRKGVLGRREGVGILLRRCGVGVVRRVGGSFRRCGVGVARPRRRRREAVGIHGWGEGVRVGVLLRRSWVLVGVRRGVRITLRWTGKWVGRRYRVRRALHRRITGTGRGVRVGVGGWKRCRLPVGIRIRIRCWIPLCFKILGGVSGGFLRGCALRRRGNPLSDW